MKKPTFEPVLPAGYVPVFTVDAKAKKTVILLNVVGTLIALALIAGFWAVLRPDLAGLFRSGALLAANAALLCGMLAYIPLHELVHGAAYKILTKQKLTFGISLGAAFCGVPSIYSYRRTALITLLAPFTVFGLLFGAGLVFFRNEVPRLVFTLLFSVHVGSCVGDLYDTFLLLTRFRSPDLLMNDTGPKQTFYLPAEKNGEK